jgi:hypothetical protein
MRGIPFPNSNIVFDTQTRPRRKAGARRRQARRGDV